jgi:uncharacterized membrane protein YhhN
VRAVLPYVLVTVVATAALLAAERAGWQPGVWGAKPVAAAGFVGAAWANGALATPYGSWILLGLVLSLAGDVLLIPKERPRVFLVGLVAFLLGHVAYTIAFAVRGLDLPTVAVALVAVLALGLLALRWLLPHVGASMRRPVLAYVVVISGMLACAAGTVGYAGMPALFAGAFAFYLSDLAVARQRFVARSFWNKAWGLPLYFGAQLVLAWTVKPG